MAKYEVDKDLEKLARNPKFLKELFEPQSDRLINNAKSMMENAKDKDFQKIWENVYVKLCSQWKKLN
jgi:hypothetical protein